MQRHSRNTPKRTDIASAFEPFIASLELPRNWPRPSSIHSSSSLRPGQFDRALCIEARLSNETVGGLNSRQCSSRHPSQHGQLNPRLVANRVSRTRHAANKQLGRRSKHRRLCGRFESNSADHDQGGVHLDAAGPLNSRSFPMIEACPPPVSSLEHSGVIPDHCGQWRGGTPAPLAWLAQNPVARLHSRQIASTTFESAEAKLNSGES